MIIKAVKTPKITIRSHMLFDVLDTAFQGIEEKSVIIVTSKIVSLCEGRAVRIGDKEKMDLIRQEASRYIPVEKNKYNVALTITRNLLVPTAGIDESNGNGYYILWPQDPYKSAREIRTHLVEKFGVTDIGVLITDSKTTPMRWGTTGIALAYAGFDALNDYIGKPDIFGRIMEVTKVNVADGLAAAAVVCMGESNEQTPLAVVSDIPFVHFNAEKPAASDIEDWNIAPEEDLYGTLLESAPWEKGDKGK